MFKHILVPLDGSACAEQALPVAARVARATGGTIVLARAMSPSIEAAWYPMGPTVPMPEVLDAEGDEVEQYLSGVAQLSELSGIETTSTVLSNTPATSILAATRAPQVDLIVMCSRGITGIKRVLTGSVTQEVARHSPVPVLALRDGGEPATCPYPDTSRPLHAFTTVVALDGSSLAEEALLPAATLTAAIAAPARGGLHLTQVVKLPATGHKREVPAEVREQALYGAKYYLREVTDRLFEGPVANLNLTITWSAAMGEDVAQTLVRVAKHGEDARGVRVFGGYDMLAMVTHGRSGPQRWVLGSVTEHVLTATRLPLFILHAPKPSDHLYATSGEEVQQSPHVETIPS